MSDTDPGFDDSTMPSAAAPFTVNVNGCNYAGGGPHTTWNPQQALFVRKTFALAGIPTDARLHLAASPIVDVYLNGHWLCHMGQAECGTQDNLVIALPEFYLRAGSNVVAVQAFGAGGSPVFDMAVTATGAVPTMKSSWGLLKARYR